MVYFIYGPDTYRSRQKLNEIIGQYEKIHKSGLNLTRLDAEESDFSEFKTSVETMSMFQEKKLIIVSGLFKDKNFAALFRDYLDSRDLFNDTRVIIVVFEKDNPRDDKNLFNMLVKKAKRQEFQPLRGYQLGKWVERQAAQCVLKIDKNSIQRLIDYAGGDPWRISNELAKLSSFRGGMECRKEDIELLVSSVINTDIFKTIDALATRDKKTAMALMQRHLTGGEDEFYLLSMITYQFRNLIRLKTHIGRSDDIQPIKLGKDLGIHPYVIKKSLAQIKKFSIEELKNIYEKIFDLDIRFKTGRVEPRMGLEMFAASI